MTKNNKKGFTIIEVVLVLAIGGLIFLMVFIALPALQASQRNTQRGNDLSRLLTAVNDYQSNNNGKTPFEGGFNQEKIQSFLRRYVDTDAKTLAVDNNGMVTNCESQFKDPDGECYNITVVGTVGEGGVNDKSQIANQNFDHTFKVYNNAGCGDEGEVRKGSGKRQVAIFYVEEGGSISCNDNH